MVPENPEESSAAVEAGKWRQCIAALVINLLGVLEGLTSGWMSPMLPQLSSSTPPIGTQPLTEDETSWLSSVAGISALLGFLVGAWASERFGRKITGCCIATPAITSWLLVLFAENFYHLLLARLLFGFFAGLSTVVVPIYVAEISATSIRGRLGSYYGFSINLGILSAFIMGSVFSYHLFAICGLSIPVIFLLSFVFMPESPVYLIKKRRITETIRSLMWLKSNDKVAVDRELVHLQQEISETCAGKKSSTLRALLRDRGTIRGLIIALSVLVGRQTSGHAAVFTYSLTIFELANSSLNATSAAIILATIQIIGSVWSAATVDGIGRRPLILVSCGVMTACHITFGVFFFLQTKHYDMSSFSWLPVAALSSYSLAYSMGIGSAAYVVAAEIFSPDIATLGISVSQVLGALSIFLITKFFPIISTKFGSHVSFFIFSLFCACTFMIAYVLLPETKGRSRESIFEELNGKSWKISHTHCNNA